jgi:uracil-DNA glycosylase
LDVKIEPSWKNLLLNEFDKAYFKDLASFVKDEYKNNQVFPPAKQIFAAFDFTPFDKVSVVIIGQDPYHGVGQANGLCFSVNPGMPLPPSLKNIYKELENDISKNPSENGDLSHWAKQGVLMLNATLTVRANQAGSHQNKGWEIFTDAIIKLINQEKNNVVFILWGAYAQKKGNFIDSNKHFIIKSAHPSPLSARNGFWGSKPFSKTNHYLKSMGLKEIKW